MAKYILSIDQGTSSTKTLIFNEQGKAVAKGVALLQTNYFSDGFVEQEPEVIYQNVLASVASCLLEFSNNGFDKNDIAAIGISNQRETFVVWDKQGKPLHNAVVWQCKRSVKICEQLAAKGLAPIVTEKTGLVIDPYFSATKLIWLNENSNTVKNAIKNGEAYFGTIDTWLLFKLTNGDKYVTDYTNASRTMFFNLQSTQWDVDLIEILGLTGIKLPSLQASSSHFGETTLNGLFTVPLPITAMIGDSHAAAFGEGCFEQGAAKATMGTGCSILMNVGTKPVVSNNGMISTICWSTEHEINYALEGVIVSCGATIEWLKNELQLFAESKETEAMANAVDTNGGVYIVPAFSGLGSPHWQMDRKASIVGLTFGTTKSHIVRAALETIPYQIKDVIAAMEKDAAIALKELMVDGGLTNNQFVMQFIANLLNKQVTSIGMPDVSALGAALLAGLKVGVYQSIYALQQISRDKKNYLVTDNDTVVSSYAEWQRIISGNF